MKVYILMNYRRGTIIGVYKHENTARHIKDILNGVDSNTHIIIDCEVIE